MNYTPKPPNFSYLGDASIDLNLESLGLDRFLSLVLAACLDLGKGFGLSLMGCRLESTGVLRPPGKYTGAH